MNVKNKVQNMSAMRRVVMAAAFAAGLWDRRDLYLGGSGNRNKGNPSWSPKRAKLKSWQKAARK